MHDVCVDKHATACGGGGGVRERCSVVSPHLYVCSGDKLRKKHGKCFTC